MFNKNRFVLYFNLIRISPSFNVDTCMSPSFVYVDKIQNFSKQFAIEYKFYEAPAAIKKSDFIEKREMKIYA